MDRRRAVVRRDGSGAAAGERFRAGPAGRGRCEMRNLFNLSQFRSHRALRLPAGRALRINFGLWPKSRCPSVVRAFGVSRLRSTRAGLGSALIAVFAFASTAAAQDVATFTAKLVNGDASAQTEGRTCVVPCGTRSQSAAVVLVPPGAKHTGEQG